jgi:aminoglycoside phosphotransferase family enzyme
MAIGKKVAFLKKARNYPYPVNRVKVKETHTSWVFIAGDFAYKLKKPVRYEVLDLSTIEARRLDCLEELKLNKRLARDIYLGIVPLILNDSGKLQLEGEGHAVDWLVKMKRLPAEWMLDRLIKSKQAGEEQILPAARLLASFYANAAPISMTVNNYLTRLSQEVETNQQELLRFNHLLNTKLIHDLSEQQYFFLLHNKHLFVQRANQNKIIEAHGNLRPENVCLFPEPVIIDCLEFNRDFRMLDPVEDLSFLAMECDASRAPEVGEIFFNVYRKETGNNVDENLVLFFKAKKACLQAQLALRHLSEPGYQNDPKWQKQAKKYLRLAGEFHKKMLKEFSGIKSP